MTLNQNVRTVDIDVRYTISKSNIPKYSKILVPDDGEEISDRAINHAISISNFSGAEIVILRVIENIENMEDTSVIGKCHGRKNKKVCRSRRQE
jgi:hypothetical protein